jgi:hypothetical protein
MGAGLLAVKSGFILFIKNYQFPLQINTLERAQGACQAHRQPFDTVFTLTEFITYRKQIHGAPTFVFFVAARTRPAPYP